MICAPGATPVASLRPRADAAMMPATWVPCPYSSRARPLRLVKSTFATIRPASSGTDATPESITAMLTPAPLRPGMPSAQPPA